MLMMKLSRCRPPQYSLPCKGADCNACALEIARERKPQIVHVAVAQACWQASCMAVQLLHTAYFAPRLLGKSSPCKRLQTGICTVLSHCLIS